MTSTLATIHHLPTRQRAIPGTKLRCALPRMQAENPCYDFITLWVAHVAFWRRLSQVRRTSNVLRDIHAELDRLDRDEGEPPDPDNGTLALVWVEQALNARNSPLAVVGR